MHQFVLTHLRLFKWLDLIVFSLVMGAAMYRFFSNAKATREGREVPPNRWFFSDSSGRDVSVHLLRAARMSSSSWLVRGAGQTTGVEPSADGC
jgi:hypothetical protein